MKIESLSQLKLSPEEIEFYKNKLTDSCEFEPNTGCWLWYKGTKKYGYGAMSVNGYEITSSRLSYMFYIGDISSGLVIRHKCDTPQCCNPHHLIEGTQKENMRDASLRKRLNGQNINHCKNGHELTDENTSRRKGKLNVRICKTCTRIKAKKDHKKRIENGYFSKIRKNLRPYCPKGHLKDRNMGTHMVCSICVNEKARVWRKNNIEKVKENKRKCKMNKKEKTLNH